MNHNPIIVALDMSPVDAPKLVQRLQGLEVGFKVGAHLFTAAGPDIIRRIHDYGGWVFLDLKYYDIPNTVALAVGSATKLCVRMLNVHTSGSLEMMQAAAKSARKTAEEIGIPSPLVLGVTVLTSFNNDGLKKVGIFTSVAAQVRLLASLASEAGLDGLICSPLEAKVLREVFGREMQLVTPGIRGPEDKADDQKRTLSAREAIDAGSDWLVIGRPIYGAADPKAATEKILATLE